MWYVAVFDAKEDVARKEIYHERSEWLKKREKVFQKKCKTIRRYEVVGSSPVKVFFIIETDDPRTLNVLSTHFGDAWYSTTYPVIERGIAEALKEDLSGIIVTKQRQRDRAGSRLKRHKRSTARRCSFSHRPLLSNFLSRSS